MTLSQQFLQAIQRYKLIAPGDRLLAGVSGGQDSLALALLLADHASELGISFVLGHLHHGLRESTGRRDQECVAGLAERLGVPFVAEQADVAALAEQEGCGLELAGRLARYRFFERAAQEHRCNKIALAHTATDRAETLLMNLFRGAGLHGLRAIPPQRGNIIRPLILASRQDTAGFCEARQVTPCEDAYNFDPYYLRNRVRRDLIPTLERDYGPGVEDALCRAADHLRDEIEWTEPLVQAALRDALSEGGLVREAMVSLPPGLRHRVLRAYLAYAHLPLTDISQERWEALETLILGGKTGCRVELGLGRYVQLEYALLVARSIGTPVPPALEPRLLPVPGQCRLGDGRTVNAELLPVRPEFPSAAESRAVLDASRAGTNLLLRPAKPGDRFVPLGMTGRKKLQDFFVDNKVPARARTPLLMVRTDGEILWVVGHRLAATAAVTPATSTYLRVSICD